MDYELMFKHEVEPFIDFLCKEGKSERIKEIESGKYDNEMFPDEIYNILEDKEQEAKVKVYENDPKEIYDNIIYMKTIEEIEIIVPSCRFTKNQLKAIDKVIKGEIPQPKENKFTLDWNGFGQDLFIFVPWTFYVCVIKGEE